MAFVPPNVLIGGPPVCCTCVMMLDAPPAAAITYVNDSMGLDPSVYGGGGSPSSTDFPDDSGFWSWEKEALVSATKDEEGLGSRDSSSGGRGTETGAEADSGGETVAFPRLNSVAGAKTRDEKGGGCDEEKLEEEASEMGECGGGGAV
mgnify:CR=1 FL=1